MMLAPAFAVCGVLLATLPVVIHLLNRRRYRTEKFAAMHLLMRAVRKTRRRVRLEHWLLLALRCGVFVMLGLALSRPVGCSSSTAAALGGQATLHVLVIDNGYPMSYAPGSAAWKSHLDRAKASAAELIDHLNPAGDSVVLITAARPASFVIRTPTYDLQHARAVVNDIVQSYQPTDLPAAFQAAVEAGQENSAQSGKVLHLYSQSAASVWQGPNANAIKAQGAALAGLYKVIFTDLATAGQWNQAVTAVRPASSLVTTNASFSTDFIADFEHFGPTHDAAVQWKVDARLLPGSDRLHGGDAATSQVEPMSNLVSVLQDGRPHVVAASIVGDDALPADNVCSRATRAIPQLRTLIVDGGSSGRAGSASQNLRAALAGVNRAHQTDGFAALEVISEAELPDHSFDGIGALILCDVSQFTVPEADRLRRFVTVGGTLMIFLSNNVVADNYNQLLAQRGLIPGPLTQRVIAPEQAGFNFDFNPNGRLHPLLKAFAHQQHSGLETAQAFGYWRADVPADPQLRVLDWKPLPGRSGPPDAAVTRQQLGRGYVVFVSTSADESWITFTRKPVYTELVNELLSGSISDSDSWMNLLVGDKLLVPLSVKFTQTPELRSPAAKLIPLERSLTTDDISAYTSPPLSEPGMYSLMTGESAVPIAVNVSPEQTDIHKIDLAAVKRALGEIDLQTADASQPQTAAAAESGSRDWSGPLLAGVMLLAAAESLSARRFDHEAPT